MMKTKGSLQLIMVMSLMCFHSASSSELSVTLIPAENPALISGPVPLVAVYSNSSPNPMRLELEYPKCLGLEFKCDDVGLVPRSVRPLGYIVQSQTIMPGNQYKVIVPLRRYFRFEEAKVYTVEWSSFVFEDPPSGNLNAKWHRSNGTFTIRMARGIVSLELVAKLGEALAGNGPESPREALELLCWIDNPAVIPYLKVGAKMFTGDGRDIVEALKRLGAKQEVREALLYVGGLCQAGVLRDALDALVDLGMVVPHSFYKERLLSADAGVRMAVLQHLEKHGGNGELVLVEPLMADTVDYVAKEAEEAKKEIEDRNPGSSAMAKSPARGPGLRGPWTPWLIGILCAFGACSFGALCIWLRRRGERNR